MKIPIAYGIDFGTTNSSISVAYDDGIVKLFDIDKDSAMPNSLPSLAYLDRRRNRLAGGLAIQQFLRTVSNNTNCAKCSLVKITKMGPVTKCIQYERGGGCQNSRLISGLKYFLSSCQKITTHSWAENFDLEDFVAIILRDLKIQVDRSTGSEVDRVVIGHPVVFPGAEGDYSKQKCALMNLKEAAIRAGFKEVELLSEPKAILLDQNLDEGYSLAIDFGGGTYDVAVLKIEKGEEKVVALEGESVGGEGFDALIFNNALADIVGVTRLPKEIAKKMSTLAGVTELLRDNKLPARVNNVKGDVIREILFGGQAYNFYKAIEKAKIELSERSVARIEFHRPGINVSQEIQRKDFERWISPSLDQVDNATRAALYGAGIKPSQVHTVLRTGGSSQIPQFVSRVEKMFPEAKIRECPAFTSVAYGLGVHARNKWAITNYKNQSRRMVSTQQIFDSMPEITTRQPNIPEPVKPTDLEETHGPMQVYKGVRQNEKVVKPPLSTPKAQSAPTPESTKTIAKPVVGKSIGTRLTSIIGKAFKKDSKTEQSKLPDLFEVPIPSWDDILETLARDEARRAANDRSRGHRVSTLVLLAYPKAGNHKIYQGRCERCGRRVFGKVQRFPDNPGKSERIFVYGDALQHRCSGLK